MPAWATVLIAIGPAAVTGFVAWFGARYQRDTSLAETDQATLRLRVEHAENERQHRQGVYHDFLKLLNAQDAMMSGWAPLDEQRYNEWLGAHYALFQGIHLFGDQLVRDALSPLTALLSEVGGEAGRGDPSVPFHERMKSAYLKRRAEIIVAEAGLTEAMRACVAAEITLPQLGAALEQQRLKPSG